MRLRWTPANALLWSNRFTITLCGEEMVDDVRYLSRVLKGFNQSAIKASFFFINQRLNIPILYATICLLDTTLAFSRR